MKTLIIFTSYYPYNLYETYLEIEIPYLAEAFDEVYIISNELGTNFKRETPGNVKSYSFPYSLNFSDKILSWFQIFSDEFWEEILFINSRYKQRITLQIINTILQSLFKPRKLRTFIDELIPGVFNREDVMLYSYWASDNAVAAAYLKKQYPHIKAVTRAHRWDVYFDTNESNYLPLRSFLAKNLNCIYFISEHAKNYFTEKTGLHADNFRVARLGVFSFTSPVKKTIARQFHLLSCSHVYARKRVSRIAEALDKIDTDINILWTHIGDGDHTMAEVENLARIISKRKKGITINFIGRLTQNQIKEFYETNYVDLFINVSESEGVPVSIMEAFSASVPALATDADGTREIVRNNENGLLIDCNFTSAELASYIQEYMELPQEVMNNYRLNARKMFAEKYNQATNYNDFVASLLSII